MGGVLSLAGGIIGGHLVKDGIENGARTLGEATHYAADAHITASHQVRTGMENLAKALGASVEQAAIQVSDAIHHAADSVDLLSERFEAAAAEWNGNFSTFTDMVGVVGGWLANAILWLAAANFVQGLLIFFGFVFLGSVLLHIFNSDFRLWSDKWIAWWQLKWLISTNGLRSTARGVVNKIWQWRIGLTSALLLLLVCLLHVRTLAVFEQRLAVERAEFQLRLAMLDAAVEVKLSNGSYKSIRTDSLSTVGGITAAGAISTQAHVDIGTWRLYQRPVVAGGWDPGALHFNQLTKGGYYVMYYSTDNTVGGAAKHVGL